MRTSFQVHGSQHNSDYFRLLRKFRAIISVFRPVFRPNSLRLTIAFTALDSIIAGCYCIALSLLSYGFTTLGSVRMRHLTFSPQFKIPFHYLNISEALSHVCSLSAWVLPYLFGYEFPLPFGITAFAFWESLMPTEDLCLPCGIPTKSYYRSWLDLFTLRPHWGYFVPHVRDAIGVGSFYTPGLGVSLSGMLDPDFNNVPTVVISHFRQPAVTKPQRRFTRVNPSNLSLALLRNVVSRWIRHYPLKVKPRDYSRRSFGWEQSLTLDWRISPHSKRATNSESHQHTTIITFLGRFIYCLTNQYVGNSALKRAAPLTSIPFPVEPAAQHQRRCNRHYPPIHPVAD